MYTVGEGPSCASDLFKIRGTLIAAELNCKANFTKTKINQQNAQINSGLIYC